jgi:hypothetical protein
MPLAIRHASTQKAGGAYPRVSLGNGLTARLMEVTPDLAREWLQKNPRIQRSKASPAWT